MTDNAFAVKNYFVKLRHLQSLQALTANPNYKVNHLWHRQQELNEELKAEADRLWELGIDVHNVETEDITLADMYRASELEAIK